MARVEQSWTGGGGRMWGYSEDKVGYLRRLRRIEGQVRGLQRMIENDEYCIDVRGRRATCSCSISRTPQTRSMTLWLDYFQVATKRLSNHQQEAARRARS
jgi:hypothetical protein